MRNIGGGRFTFLPSGTLSRTGTNTITTDSDACSSVASHFETFTDGLRACAAAPQPYSSMHSINAGGEVDISYPSNGIWPNVPQSNLVATFPIPDPSEPAQIQPVTCDLSITGGVEDVDVCFGTSGNPAADWGWASCNFLGFADGISGKCFATIGFGSFPPATTPSTRTASITGFSLAVVRGSGVCASGMSVDVSFVKTASYVNTGHTFRVESRLTLTARCLDVAPCVSGIESRDPNLPTLPCDGCGGAGLPQSPEDAEAMLR